MVWTTPSLETTLRSAVGKRGRLRGSEGALRGGVGGEAADLSGDGASWTHCRGHQREGLRRGPADTHVCSGGAEGSGVGFADGEEEGDVIDVIGVGKVDVVEKDVGKFNLAQDPPQAYDESVARPEGPGRVPRRVRVFELGDTLEGEGSGLLRGPQAPEGGTCGVSCDEIELGRPWVAHDEVASFCRG